MKRTIEIQRQRVKKRKGERNRKKRDKKERNGEK